MLGTIMITLENALYMPIEGAVQDAVADKAGTTEFLGRLIGRIATQARGRFEAGAVGTHYIVSTMIDIPLSRGWLSWSSLQSAIQRAANGPVDGFINAYECANWGFVLRHLSKRRLPSPRVQLTIVDVNLFDLDHWYGNRIWGQSGLGTVSLVFRLSDCSEDIFCGVAKGANHFGDFCIALRSLYRQVAPDVISVPYFQPELAQLYDRLLPLGSHLANRYETHGHSFGADPWIGIIEDVTRMNHPNSGKIYLPASLSLNGYWGACRIQLSDGGLYSLLPRGTLQDEYRSLM